jgi:putative ATPase
MLFPDIDQISPKLPEKPLSTQGPLAFRLTPKTLADFFGQEEIMEEGSLLRQCIETDSYLSVILWGPPGCGKTSIARLIQSQTKNHFISLNAVTISVADIRSVVEKAKKIQQAYQKSTLVFLDEIHRLTKVQQDALLPDVESGLLVLIGATTENPYFNLIPALLSRTKIIQFNGLNLEHLIEIFDNALTLPEIRAKQWTFTKEGKDFLIAKANGDARKLLNSIEWLLKVADHKTELNEKTILSFFQEKGLKYSDDDHYDIISAFIKSIRGSDPDAAIYWLARMLKGGEDPVFLARRLMILASEDIGNADPQALSLTAALMTAVQHVGMPEVQLNFAHVVAYLALAPKSNAATIAIGKANQLIEAGEILPVPIHLKDSHYQGAQKMGHGEGYLYPHDYPNGYVNQEYLPKDYKLYEPKEIGFEKELKKRQLKSRGL